MNFCSQCSAPVVWRIPLNDNRCRFVCDTCGAIHYQNPRIVAGCVPIWNDRVLLCRRAIEPRRGCWTLPAGFMENGETTAEGAQRETREEAGAEVVIERLFTYINIPRIDQVYVMFIATLISPEHAPGAESLETGLYLEAQIPWDRIAFPAVDITLRQFFCDRRNNVSTTHLLTVDRHPGDLPK